MAHRRTIRKDHRIELAALGTLRQPLVIGNVTQLFHRGIGVSPGCLVMTTAQDEQIQMHSPSCIHQLFTSPPSTTRFWPVTARDQGEAKNITASANSAGVVTDPNGVLAAIASKTGSGVTALASVVRSRPPLTMFTRTPLGPSSAAKVRVKDNSAAFAAV